MLLRVLGAVLWVSFVVSPFSRSIALAQSPKSPMILRIQGDRIRKNLAPAVATYRRAKRAYELNGPQGFVDVVASPARLYADDKRALVALFHGLHQLPEVEITHRGFEFADRSKTYRVSVEVMDYETRALKINGVGFNFNDKESFEVGAARLQRLLSEAKVSWLDKAWEYVVPEAHAFLVPLLVGGALYAVMRMFFDKGKTDALAAQKKDHASYAAEPAATPIGGAHSDALQVPGGAAPTPPSNPQADALFAEWTVAQKAEFERRVAHDSAQLVDEGIEARSSTWAFKSICGSLGMHHLDPNRLSSLRGINSEQGWYTDPSPPNQAGTRTPETLEVYFSKVADGTVVKVMPPKDMVTHARPDHLYYYTIKKLGDDIKIYKNRDWDNVHQEMSCEDAFGDSLS